MNKIWYLCLLLCSCVLFVSFAGAQTNPVVPDLSISIGGDQIGNDGAISATLKIILLLTLVSFLPAMMLTTTSFTRIVVVLSMTRTSLGTQQAPPNMILTALALFLTIAIMNPVYSKVYTDALEPYLNGSMAEKQAIRNALAPIRKFLIDNTREPDIGLFLRITKSEAPENPEDISIVVLIPAFVVSELNKAFQIAFLIALPFLVLDMVVSSVLTSMSMITLPPVVISLPLKLMLFVIVDGWSLIIESLVKTYVV